MSCHAGFKSQHRSAGKSWVICGEEKPAHFANVTNSWAPASCMFSGRAQWLIFSIQLRLALCICAVLHTSWLSSWNIKPSKGDAQRLSSSLVLDWSGSDDLLHPSTIQQYLSPCKNCISMDPICVKNASSHVIFAELIHKQNWNPVVHY